MMIEVQVLFASLFLGIVSGYGNFNETHICCDGETVTQRDPKSSVYCCGLEIYDSERQICCGATLADRPTDNTTKIGCCLNMETNEYTTYDYSRFMCCRTEIVEKEDKDEYYSCCNNSLYKMSESRCCSGNITPKVATQKCCGAEAYDLQTQICSIEYDREQQKMAYEIMDIENNHTAVCNKQLYDTQTHACCSDRVVVKDESLRDDQFPGCCGTGDSIITYNHSSHVCCEFTGELLPIPANLPKGFWPQCCEGQIFSNYSWQQCCNGKIVDRPSRHQGYCCGYEMITDYKTQLCCNDVIHIHPEGSKLDCCMDTVYNYDDAFCCNGVVSHVDIDFADCCYSGRNATAYDRRTEYCGSLGVTKLNSDKIERMMKLTRSTDALCGQL